MDRHWQFPVMHGEQPESFNRKSMLKEAGVNPDDIKTQEDSEKLVRSLHQKINMQWALYLEHMHLQ